MAFAEIAKWNHFIFLQNDGLPGFLLNSFVQLRASNGLLIVWRPWKSVWHFFYVIHFVDTQFREILVCFLGTKIMAFAAIAKWNHFIFLQNDGLPGFLLNSFVQLRASDGLLILWSPWKFVLNFFYVIHFADTQFREILVCFLGPKIMAFAEIAKWNHLIFLQNDGLPGFLLNSFVSLPTSNGLLILWSPWKSVWHFFYIIHFVDTQFRENLSVFPWHQNYGFCRDREMK